MRIAMVAALGLLAACNDASADSVIEPDSGFEMTTEFSLGEAPEDDLYVVCSLPFDDTSDVEMTEIRSFIAYEGELRNFSEFDSSITDNCSPARHDCRDRLEDGMIISHRTPFDDSDERVRVLRVDLDTMSADLGVIEGQDELATGAAVTCEREPYPDQVYPPSPF